PLAVRDRAMFELLYSSGLRLSELTSLAPADVSVADATVRVTGKGNKTRIVPVGLHALQAIQTWLPVRESLPLRNESPLFLTHRGQSISPRSVRYRLKACGIKHHLHGNVHPYLLRHSLATQLLRSSRDL